MEQEQVTGPTGAQNDFDADHYPSIADVFAVVLERLDDPNAPIDRVEVTALASGEATYRVYPARAEEPDMGYIHPSEFA